MDVQREEKKAVRSSFIVAALIVLLAGIGAWYYFMRPATPLYTHEFTAGESISTWGFQGAYTGKAELESRAQTEIDRLTDLIGVEGDEATDYTIYISIANQYHLLGDGAQEYEYLKRALGIDAEITGLAWHNLGTLLAQLGAPQSARDAYARAVKAQGQQINYQSRYLEFLTQNFKDDTGAIEAAFTDAASIFGDNATLLEIRARWLESVGRYQDAIDAWKKASALSPTPSEAIQTEIKRLESLL